MPFVLLIVILENSGQVNRSHNINFDVCIWRLEHPSSADNAVSKNKTDFEIGPSLVTLSEAKGLSQWVTRCFAAAQHDSIVTHAASPACHPEPQRRVCHVGLRDASLRLSMTALSHMLLPPLVTLSRSEGSVPMGHEMLRCGSA